MNKISGYTCVRNGVSLDYCFKLTISSLLKVCDEVVVGYKESTDDTLEQLKAIEAHNPTVRIVYQKWDNPVGNPKWWTDWINETRQHLQYPVQLMLDADEVLCDDIECLASIRRIADLGTCAWFKRLNFVKDGRHLIPSGHCCGDEVVRLGPTQYWMPSDEPHPEGEVEIRRNAVKAACLKIYHYGFIRKMEAFYPKIDEVNRIWFGRREERLDEHRKANAENWYEIVEWGRQLVPYFGTHPAIAQQWLKERGRL